MPSRRLRLALAAASVSVLALAPARADAHPFGDPQTLTLAADGDRVVAEWRVGGLDDLTLLAVALDLLPRNRIFLDGAVRVEPGDPAVLAAAPELETYLLDNLSVSSAGEACRGEVTDVSDLAGAGARVVFTCPGLATDGRAEVTSTMLTDLHPAYQLLATGPDGQRARYDADHPTHGWVLDGSVADAGSDLSEAGTQLGRSALTQISAVLGGLVVLAGGGYAVVRRRARPRGEA